MTWKTTTPEHYTSDTGVWEVLVRATDTALPKQRVCAKYARVGASGQLQLFDYSNGEVTRRVYAQGVWQSFEVTHE